MRCALTRSVGAHSGPGSEPKGGCNAGRISPSGATAGLE
jgi:hypothetical protein